MVFVASLAAFAVACACTIALAPLAHRIGLVDMPGGRKDHSVPTPEVGGLAMFAGMLAVLVVAPSLIHAPVAYLSAGALLVTIGAWDDIRPTSPWTRLGAQSVAGLLMIGGAGLVVGDLGECFGGDITVLGALAVPFTIFATVGLINAFNMMDGIDGLLGTVTLVKLLVILVLALDAGAAEIGNHAMLLMAVVLAFLLFNWKFPGRTQAKVFMGDSGSMFLGFSMAWLLISLMQPANGDISPTSGLWVVAMPVMDVIALMIRRKWNGRSLMEPDRDHFHHIALRSELSVNETVLVITIVSGAFATLGVLGDAVIDNEPFMCFAFVVICALFTYFKIEPDRACRVMRMVFRRPKARSYS